MVILFDRYNLPDDVFETIFATESQTIVGKELVRYMIAKGGEITKTEMSVFATEVHEGKYECVIDKVPYKGKKVRISYNKRQFYERILTPMKSMGLVDYDMYKKTYRLSIKFSQDLINIGNEWKVALKKMGFKGV